MLTSSLMFQRSVVVKARYRSLRDHFNISGNEATVHDLQAANYCVSEVK